MICDFLNALLLYVVPFFKDWAWPIVAGIFTGIVTAKMVTYQQAIATAAASMVNFATLALCQTYDDARDDSRAAHRELSKIALALTCQRHVQASEQLSKIATGVKIEIDAILEANQSVFARRSPQGVQELAAKLSYCANRWAKEVAVIRTRLRDFINPFPIPRGEMKP